MNRDNPTPLDALTRSLQSTLHPSALHPPYAAIAWSGGADSTALLHAYLHLLRTGPAPPSHSQPVTALHIDHALHPQSAQHALWCAHTASSLPVQLLTRSLNGPHLKALSGSLEANARLHRYRALGDLLLQNTPNITLLLTAHHAQDNLETLLLALLRGSGLAGLSGIRPKLPLRALSQSDTHQHISVLRPLLHTSQDLLLNTLNTNQHTFIQDPTNASLQHTRNLLRHTLLPKLLNAAHSPQAPLRSPQLLRDDLDLLEHITHTTALSLLSPQPLGVAQSIALQRPPLQNLHPSLQKRVLQHCAHALPHLQTSHPPLSSKHLQRLTHAIQTTHHTHTLQLHKLSATLFRDIILLHPHHHYTLPPPSQTTLHTAHHTPSSWGLWTFHTEHTPHPPPDIQRTSTTYALFDADLVQLPLHITPPNPKHTYQPLHKTSPKPLNRIFIDTHTPNPTRPHTPVLFDNTGQPLLIPGVTRLHTAPLSPNTQSILSIQCTPHHTPSAYTPHHTPP